MPALRVEVVVPFRDGCEYRERARDYVALRYATEHSGWTVTHAEGGDPWVKALAVMPAVTASEAEVIVVADADVWTDAQRLREAVSAVERGAAWAMPHRRVLRLSERATSEVLDGTRLSEVSELETAEEPHDATFGGGIVVARRGVILSTPLDPHFVGWG